MTSPIDQDDAWAESDERQVRAGATALRGAEAARRGRELLTEAAADDPYSRALLDRVMTADQPADADQHGETSEGR